jgi:PIN domain nuclease of toxin-antitoxin system
MQKQKSRAAIWLVLRSDIQEKLRKDRDEQIGTENSKLENRKSACAVSQPLAISDLVLWELAMPVRRGRIQIELDGSEFPAWLPHVTVFPISLEVARESTQLDFSSDPADEIIAATSVVENIPLLTRDRRIHKSRTVPLTF